MKIAIIGAGLGGLTAATCFAKAGHSVVVYEKRDSLSPQGGILGLRPSALKVLYAHGLKAQIQAISQPLGESQFRMLANGKLVRSSDLHEDEVDGEGLTMLTVRPRLARLLLGAARESGVRVEFGLGVRGFEEDGKKVVLELEDGGREGADLVFAADGIRSRLREKILVGIEAKEYEPIVTDSTFYVFRLATGSLPDDVKERMYESNGDWKRMTAWLGQDTWAMSAPDSEEGVFNLGLTIVEPTNQTSLWDEGGDVDYVREHFQGRACEDILELLKVAASCDRWRLAYMPSLPRWSSVDGRVALLGDAAHAILPNGGAGITLTMEDVGTLNYLLSHHSDKGIPEILRIWEKACKPRADRINQFGKFNMRRLQGDKEALMETEKALKKEAGLDRQAVKPDMNAQFSKLAFARWLSGYDPVAAVKEVM